MRRGTLVWRFLLLLLVMIGADSCARREPTTLEPVPLSFGPPVVEPLPLRIRYYFEPSIDVLYPWSLGSTRYRLWLGPATRVAFERLFSALFVDAREAKVVPTVPGWPGDLDGVVRVGLVQVLLMGKTTEVTYELAFLDPDGTERGRWRVLGTDRVDYVSQWSSNRAIRAAAAKVAREIDQQFAIRAWLERRRPTEAEPRMDE